MKKNSCAIHGCFIRDGYSLRVRTIFCLPCLFALVVEVGAATQRLVIDRSNSQVEVAVHATVDSFTAKLANYDAQIEVDPATARVTAARFQFRFAELKTGKEKRDREMHEWQQTEAHPDGEFALTALESTADGRFTARGTLRLHGVTKELSFPVAVTTDRRLFAVDGEPSLDTRDFGLGVIRKFAVLKVDPVVKVRFHLQGSLPVSTVANGGSR